MGSFTYVGSELDLFSQCVRWKDYFRSRLAPHIGSDVLEVGAGIGANTAILLTPHVRRWVCLEPDAGLAAQIQQAVASGSLPSCCEVRIGTLNNAVKADERFDTAMYVDVLEHIEDDKAEMTAAAARLRPGGTLIVLAPAHGFLFSPFDTSIGHYRRYDAAMMRALTQPDLDLIALQSLDSIGLFASLANRLLLKQSMPTRGQLAVWDRYMVPLSRWVDPVLGYRVGKSIIGVWKKKR